VRLVTRFKLDDIQRKEIIGLLFADMHELQQELAIISRMKYIENQMGNRIGLEDLPEFALLSVYIELKFGSIDTLGVRDTGDIFDVTSSSEDRKHRRSDVGIDGCLKIQWTRLIPRVVRRWGKSGVRLLL